MNFLLSVYNVYSHILSLIFWNFVLLPSIILVLFLLPNFKNIFQNILARILSFVAILGSIALFNLILNIMLIFVKQKLLVLNSEFKIVILPILLWIALALAITFFACYFLRKLVCAQAKQFLRNNVFLYATYTLSVLGFLHYLNVAISIFGDY